ncbi:hypothetical protein CsSME_00050296 [Camellia sinensis var. sinensis]
MERVMTEILQNSKTLVKARAKLEQTSTKENKLKNETPLDYHIYKPLSKKPLGCTSACNAWATGHDRSIWENPKLFMPKGAQVLVNAWATGHDPSSWENPQLFMPERFFGSQVDVHGHDFKLIEFGAGRRICPRLPLATRMLQLMLGSLIEWTLYIVCLHGLSTIPKPLVEWTLYIFYLPYKNIQLKNMSLYYLSRCHSLQLFCQICGSNCKNLTHAL